MFQPYLPVENGAREERGSLESSLMPLFSFLPLLRNNSLSYTVLVPHVFPSFPFSEERELIVPESPGLKWRGDNSPFLFSCPDLSCVPAYEWMRVNRGAAWARCVNEMWPRRCDERYNRLLISEIIVEIEVTGEAGSHQRSTHPGDFKRRGCTLNVLVLRSFRSLLSSSSCFMPGRRRDRFSLAAVVVGVYTTGRLRARRDSHLSGYIRRKWGGPRA